MGKNERATHICAVSPADWNRDKTRVRLPTSFDLGPSKHCIKNRSDEWRRSDKTMNNLVPMGAHSCSWDLSLK